MGDRIMNSDLLKLPFAVGVWLTFATSSNAWFHKSSYEEDFVQACEEILKIRLVSPSGYSRIDYTVMDEEFVALNKEGERPTEIIISYDSPNSYGTEIRGAASCTLVDSSPDDFGALDKSRMRVDGLSLVEFYDSLQ